MSAVICPTFLVFLLGFAEADINVALGKPARQSTIFGGYFDTLGPHMVVDGNRNNKDHDQSCLHTEHGDNSPFWQVDLLATYIIDSILVVNRESRRSRTHDFTVTMYMHDPSLPYVVAGAVCVAYAGILGPTDAERINCTSPVIGRYVKLTKVVDNNDDVLNFCEIEIYGVPSCSGTSMTKVQGQRLDANKEVMLNLPLLHCIVACGENSTCTAANFRSSDKTCELLNNIQSTDSMVPDSEWVHFG